MADPGKTLLLIEGNHADTAGLSQRLQKLGFRVLLTSSWEEITENLYTLPSLDLVLMEIDPRASVETVQATQRILEKHDLPIVFLSGSANLETVARVEALLSYGCLPKNADDQALAAALKMAMKLHDARRQLQQATQALDQSGQTLKIFERNYAEEVHKVQQDLAWLLSKVPDLYFRLKTDGTILSYLGSQANQLYAPVEQFTGEVFQDFLPPSASIPALNAIARVGATGQPADIEYVLPMPGGAQTYEARLFPVDGDELVAIVRNITERKQIEQALRESETRFRTIWMESPAGLELYDADGRLMDVNPTCLKIFGLKRVDDARGFSLMDDPKITPELKEHLRQGKVVRYETAFDFEKVGQPELYPASKSGQRDLEVIIRPLTGAEVITGYLVQVQDSTERKQFDEAQARALKEKNTLLRDLQHRIKNSLSMITSLIQLQRYAAVHPETQAALEDLHGRVHSLADLYGLLYETKNVEYIQLGEYLNRVAGSLARSYGHDHRSVQLWVECDEIIAYAQPATAFGLILNELLTNAFKYAFPDDRPGNIWVDLHLRDSQVSLVVSNDGVAPPPGFSPQASSGMGMQIVQMLAEELAGRFDYQRDEKTVFMVQAPCAVLGV